MEAGLLKMFLIAHVSAEFGKHIYVPDRVSWPDAQKLCRENYTDLSPITTPWEKEKLRIATRKKVFNHVWTGLYKNQSQWLWSGGGVAKDVPWSPSQPDGTGTPAAVVCWHNCDGSHGMHDFHQSFEAAFFCINLIVVENRQPWEEALEYCRVTHTTLTSLVSETENLLAQREIQRGDISERVWIGVRYLGDSWMWVNGDPMAYEAWPTGAQDQQCPVQNRCGALNKAGLWEAVDCKVRLNFICY